MNCLTHGRPAKVELAILVDRGGRLMPFAPDYCGLAITAKDDEKVVVALDAPIRRKTPSPSVRTDARRFLVIVIPKS